MVPSQDWRPAHPAQRLRSESRQTSCRRWSPFGTRCLLAIRHPAWVSLLSSLAPSARPTVTLAPCRKADKGYGAHWVKETVKSRLALLRRLTCGAQPALKGSAPADPLPRKVIGSRKPSALMSATRSSKSLPSTLGNSAANGCPSNVLGAVAVVIFHLVTRRAEDGNGPIFYRKRDFARSIAPVDSAKNVNDVR